MLFERIESKGLAHYSYLIGDRNEAVVIDPRRDCDIYVDKASREGYRITHILETHRNEDYVVGSTELASRTGAEIWHADEQLDYRYGKPAKDGQTWKIGNRKLEAIHSPGHTPGSMSYLLYDHGDAPWMVFTGDALFAGDIGRVDLVGVDRKEEMAGLLYDTLFNKLLTLGDYIIVCPGHGAGSVCAADIADRTLTTIGLERRLNPKLQYTHRDDFIANVAKELERPPYFRRMEKLNVEGAPLMGTLPIPTPLSASEFAEKSENGIVLDTRMEVGFGAAHVPNSLSVWLEGLPSFAGWFLSYDVPLLLVNETNDPLQAVRYLIRLGYDNLAGYLSGSMLSWHTAGKQSNSIQTFAVEALGCHLDEKGPAWILDVRSEDEIKNSGALPHTHNIHITQLPLRMDEVPKDHPVYIFCGSGLRSMIAASLLQRQGWDNLIVVLGGLAGWKSDTCPVIR